jgi:hypothetical protein
MKRTDSHEYSPVLIKKLTINDGIRHLVVAQPFEQDV